VGVPSPRRNIEQAKARFFYRTSSRSPQGAAGQQ
jgi:hypothetical protein